MHFHWNARLLFALGGVTLLSACGSPIAPHYPRGIARRPPNTTVERKSEVAAAIVVAEPAVRRARASAGSRRE